MILQINPVTPNPNLALWVAALGFASSLLVVIINSVITLRAKNIDAQQKKNEQLFSYNLAYLNRKLDAGEKAVGRLSLQLKGLSLQKINFSQILTQVYFDEKMQESKQKNYEAVSLKLIESHYTNAEYYLAYFPNEFNYSDENNVITRCNHAENDALLATRALDALYERFEKEPEGNSKNTILKSLDGMYLETKEKIELYLKLNNEAAAYITSMCDKIRLKMEEAASQLNNNSGSPIS